MVVSKKPIGYTVLVDGYNVIKRHSAWRDVPLLQARTRLLLVLHSTRWPVPVSAVHVVFDGPETAQTTVRQQSPWEMHVEFASPSADALIQARIRTHPHPNRLVVISDDGEIAGTAKDHGAHHYSTTWLLDRTRPHRRLESADQPAPRLPARLARQITQELAQRWKAT